MGIAKSKIFKSTAQIKKGNVLFFIIIYWLETVRAVLYQVNVFCLVVMIWSQKVTRQSMITYLIPVPMK